MPYAPAKEKAYQTAYRAAHREEFRAYKAVYRAAHREELRAAASAYNDAHRDAHRAYRATHRDERRAYDLAYYKAHREERRAYEAAAYAARGATYRSWQAMRDRCNRPKNIGYPYYGGRGITYDPRWNSYEVFLADVGERPPGTTLDRIDNDGNYEPGNVKWSTPREQALNRRAA